MCIAVALTCLSIVVAPPLLRADDPIAVGSAYLSPEMLRDARSGISREISMEEGPRLFPAIPESRDILASLGLLKPTTGVEMLMYASLPGVDLTTAVGRLALYRELQAVSTLRGVTYYSTSRNRERTLFKDAYVVSSPDDTHALPDPKAKELAERERLYVLLHDTTFGRGVYAVDYVSAPEYLILRVTNTASLKLLFIPIIPAQGMEMHYVVFPGKEEALVYGVGMARVGRVGRLSGREESSFAHRVVAMYEWLRDRLGRMIR